VSDRLYDLLPAIYRMRDAGQGEPLRAVLSVISEQVDLVEADIARLYDNWFIETCDDWVVPYIGDLIGYTPVLEAGQAPAAASRESDLRGRILFPRAEVAATLDYRARKGTLALLGSLADGVAGWPALAVEFYQRLMWTQHIDHLRLSRGRTVDLRDGDALDRLGGAFDRVGYSADIRRPDSHRTRGRANIPSVGVFVWRLKSYSVTHAPAYCVEADGPHCFTFSVLGNDTQLFNRVETAAGHARHERSVPQPIRRRALEDRVTQHPPVTRASADYYGVGRSIAVYAPGWPASGAPQPVPRALVIPADLSDWRYRVPKGQIAVDPVRGRIIFPTGQLPRRGAWVDYQYGFSADMGGGEYERTVSQPVTFALYRVGGTDKDAFATINAALTRWRGDQQDLGAEPPKDAAEHAPWLAAHEKLRAAVVEIQDSAAYTEPLTIALAAGESLQIRAASGCRPTLRVLDYMTERSDALSISGEHGSRFKLDGLIVTGRGIAVHGPDGDDPERAAKGDLCDVTIRHCTLVPGWGLDCGCEPTRPNEPSLELFGSSAKVRIESSILGSIHVTADETALDPVAISICDSIVDATSPARLAIGAPDLPLAFAQLTILRSTVIGAVGTHAIARAENSIFLGVVTVGRRQQGCLRFCYVEPGSRTPRRYRCQPDIALAALCPNLSDGEKAAKQTAEQSRLRPCFNSTRYGTPTYCQLASDCAEEIARGADDESEMGVFHDLFQPQRAANLGARIEEYTPAGLDVAILFAS
jgi:hypothetical protein